MNAPVFLLVALLCGVIYSAHNSLNTALTQKNSDQTSVLVLPPPMVAKACSSGYEKTLADFYWLQFVQYVGDTTGRERDQYGDAAKYLDLVTMLDPTFIKAYYFAAFIVGREMHEPRKAALLIERGIAANPSNWYVPFIAGVNQYLYAHDEQAAARYYKLASTYPEAPDWLLRQSLILQAKIPSLVKEINVWDSLYRSAGDRTSKERARGQLSSLWLKVYRTAPTKTLRAKAREQLQKLSVVGP